MTRQTLGQALTGIGSIAGLRIRAVVRLTPVAADYGLIVTERPDAPGVLGLGSIDRDGDAAAVGLSVDEVATLRDELTAWLNEQPSDVAPVPDPWTDPDAAAAHQPPPF